jgi:3-(3-hydroxy-phenyl)propionate hydroxylase
MPAAGVAVMTSRQDVIIAGAGPVGLMTALGLAKQGMSVLVVEQEPALTVDLRAGTYHPPTLEMMAPYGVTARMLEIGIRVPIWQIRDRRSGAVAEFDLGLLGDVTPYPYRFHLEQHKLTPIIYDFLRSQPTAEVRFGTRFVDAAQDADGVRVTVEREGTTDRLEASWLVGADGGRSDVRKAAGFEFEGFTWPELFFVISVTEDLEMYGYAKNSYIADPHEWIALFKMPGNGPPGMWRVIWPLDPSVAEEVYSEPEAMEERLQRFQPKAGRYEVLYNSFYRVHQRVATEFRRGRVILAGDAAHLNNPLGAFGLNSGIHDAANLIDKLGRIRRGEDAEALLSLYERQRRTATVEHVQENSIRNKRLLEEKDPAVRRKRFDELQRTAATRELAREFLLTSSMITSVRRAAAVA